MTYAVFILFTLMALGGGVLVVTQRNLVRAATALVLTLFGVAGLYVLLEAGFLAAVQVLVYIGAIAILIIFAIMLTRRMVQGDQSGLNRQWGWALVSAVVLFALFCYMVVKAWPLALVAAGSAPAVPADSTEALGLALLDWEQYVLPFEVASVLLLSAMVGAVVIAREKHGS